MPAKPIHLFNTKTSKIEPFSPKSANDVKVYTCGPTVYNFAHIGNLRTYVAEDLLIRTLRHFGYHVHHVMNLTDVDDKTIKGALASKQDLNEYTQKFKDAFFDDLKALNIVSATQFPAATDHIAEMIEMIEVLLKKEIAYKGQDESIYFSISKFPEYGSLSHLKLDELVSNASDRIQSDEYDKESAQDFVLWKHYDEARDGSVYWDSPFGKGRPGWHLECSAMAMHYLGQTLDLHMGGVDNIFPHHENEIAQSQACTQHDFCPFWVHIEHLLVDGKKMSKSLGNFYTLRDLIKKGFDPKQVRYLLLSTHYKTQLNFTLDNLKGAKSSIERLQNLISRLLKIKNKESTYSLQPALDSLKSAFESALAQDLNISQALSHLFDFVRETNSLIDQEKLSHSDAMSTLKLFREFNEILGVLSFETQEVIFPKELVEAMFEREKARKTKNWKEADRLRDLIDDQGYAIEDTPHGPQLRKKS